MAIAIGAVFSTALGLIAGYRGGRVDRIIMRAAGACSSVLFYIPLIWLAIWLAQVFGQSFAVAALALLPGAWAGIARHVREVAARFMTRHLTAAIVNAVVVGCVLQAGRVVVLESVLSFLGAGVPSPAPSWGADISAGRSYFGAAWWVVVFPAMAILLTALAFNFVGGWLRDRWELRHE